MKRQGKPGMILLLLSLLVPTYTSASQVTAVSEPGVFSLLGVGAVIGLIALIRRRK